MRLIMDEDMECLKQYYAQFEDGDDGVIENAVRNSYKNTRHRKLPDDPTLWTVAELASDIRRSESDQHGAFARRRDIPVRFSYE